MTNAEKYLKEGVESRYFATALYKFILTANRNINNQNSILGCINTFLELPYKPKLSADEIVILRNINADFIDTISRNSFGELILHYAETDNEDELHYLKNDLFQFIKERRRI